MQNFGVRLSDFTPTLRDLDIKRQQIEMQTNPEAFKSEFKDITDLASLPVYDFIDVKLQNSSCELCGEEFKSENKAEEKKFHLWCHFDEQVIKDLPSHPPFKCPKCPKVYVSKRLSLFNHYTLTHKAIFLAMQRELGPDQWRFGDLDNKSDNN